ncbi:class I SAM-dependent methyltransferase [Sediminispirochaeta bajacaliforniensis]|uniref:class I SAM-dependent methyltransferase n=1 Tax=Sediminispirochaeta bajacaliforniensis TaxID=148 RepID=UPI000372371B|nr:class I SAM-dependent methyltransferase [Sediminispirochaeta bajacaliforniensis]
MEDDRRERWNSRYRNGNNHHKVPSPIFLKETAPLQPGKALDLAAGTGHNAMALASRGWEVTAVDFSDVAIEAGKAMAAEAGLSIHGVIADVRSYDPEPQSFDLVTICYFHPGTELLALVLQKAQKALKHEGTLLVIGHDAKNTLGGPQNQELLYTPQKLTALLAGMEIIKAESQRHPSGYDTDGAPVQVDCVVTAKKR